MLQKLVLDGVGPADHMEWAPVARRFNLITGDNGLGKSFLLEAAWWALTRTWHETPAVPSRANANISYAFDGESKPHASTSEWSAEAQEWKRKSGRPPNPGLVLYARIDGSFSAWDPARNYRLYQRTDGGEAQSPAAYQFSSSQVFEGLRREVMEGGSSREQVVCAGLIEDWRRWQETKAPQFDLLVRLLSCIGPDDEPLIPGALKRPTIDDVRLIPTIRMPYGQDVPLTYCPAGVRRMCKLAYLLAWTLHEHAAEANRIGQPMSRQVIVLIDEPETHLHPRWQRTVLTGLANAIATWRNEQKPEVQFLVATHSPLVLASLEPEFDVARDALWKLELVAGSVQLERDVVYRRGDVNRWLTSDVFDLAAPTSTAAERARADAEQAMTDPDVSPARVARVQRDLEAVLPEMDPFFIRWRYYMGGKTGDLQRDSG
jgi:hypothetical protein